MELPSRKRKNSVKNAMTASAKKEMPPRWYTKKHHDLVSHALASATRQRSPSSPRGRLKDGGPVPAENTTPSRMLIDQVGDYRAGSWTGPRDQRRKVSDSSAGENQAFRRLIGCQFNSCCS